VAPHISDVGAMSAWTRSKLGKNIGGGFVVFFLGGQNRNFGKHRESKLLLSLFYNAYKLKSYSGNNLRCIWLLDCQQISNKGFGEAARKLLQLEEVDISFCDLLKCSLEVLGRSCPLLKSLKFVIMGYEYAGYGEDEVAFVIAETMPGLRRLNIRGNVLTNVGLLAILDGCPLLESLNIAECYNLRLCESLKKRCQ